TDVAKPHQFTEHERLAAKVHKEFRRKAEATDTWSDVDAAVQAALRDPAVARDAASPEAWDNALLPFAEPDVVARPFYLAPDLRWLTFETAAPRRLQPMRMEEDGSLAAQGEAIHVEPAAIDAPTMAGLRGILQRLAARDLFAGSVFDAVDGMFYEMTVAEA